MTKKRKIIIGIIALLVIIQFFQIDKTPPESPPNSDFIQLEKPPLQVAETLKNACYDCHSHASKYPWYTSIQPLGWWIRGHIRGGRMNLNFSTWDNYDGKQKAHKKEEVVEEVLENHMPLKSYVWIHPEAKMSDSDKQTLITWFKGGVAQ